VENRKSINGEMLTRDETVNKNKGLIWKAANRYRRVGESKGLEPHDLFSICAIGLIKAYDRFDPDTYDVKFSTYAFPMMFGEVQRYLRDNAGDLKFSRTIYELSSKILKAEMQDEPIQTLMIHFDEDEVAVKNALYLIYNNKAKSINTVVHQGSDGDDITLEENLGNNDLSDYSSINVNEFLESLSERDRKMVELTMQGMKQAEIGKQLGVTQVQVSRLMRKLYDYTETFFGYPLGYFQDRPNISIQEGEKKMKDKVKKGKSRALKGDIEKAKELLATTKRKNSSIAKETGVSEQSVHYWAKKIRTPEVDEAPVTISHIEPITINVEPLTIEKTVEEVQNKIQKIEEQIFSSMGVPKEFLPEEPQIAHNPFDDFIDDMALEARKKAEEKEAFEKHLAGVKEQEDKENQLIEETDQIFTYAAQKEGVNSSELNTIFKRVGHVAATSGLKKLNVTVAVSTEKLPSLRGSY
jgi:RNA polymerase sporulation-specific sigma factor